MREFTAAPYRGCEEEQAIAAPVFTPISRGMTRYEPTWLLFASDGAMLALSGGACLLAAIIALFMDRRRHNRDRIAAADRVGWVPWTLIFLTGAMTGLGLIAASFTV